MQLAALDRSTVLNAKSGPSLSTCDGADRGGSPRTGALLFRMLRARDERLRDPSCGRLWRGGSVKQFQTQGAAGKTPWLGWPQGPAECPTDWRGLRGGDVPEHGSGVSAAVRTDELLVQMLWTVRRERESTSRSSTGLSSPVIERCSGRSLRNTPIVGGSGLSKRAPIHHIGRAPAGFLDLVATRSSRVRKIGLSVVWGVTVGLSDG